MSAIGMPAHLLALFAPRDPLPKLPQPKKRKRSAYLGLAELTSQFETTPPPPVEPFEPPKAKKARLAREKLEAHAKGQKEKIAAYDAHHDPDHVKTEEPRRTVFVGRLSYETTEKKLLKTFEQYGDIRDLRVVTDKLGKPRGYAFIEFKSSEAARQAIRQAWDRPLDGRRIIVDMERGRTVSGWLPRRLGGGEGPPRRGRKPAPKWPGGSAGVPPRWGYDSERGGRGNDRFAGRPSNDSRRPPWDDRRPSFGPYGGSGSDRYGRRDERRMDRGPPGGRRDDRGSYPPPDRGRDDRGSYDRRDSGRGGSRRPWDR